jgi:hypothetical protein
MLILSLRQHNDDNTQLITTRKRDEIQAHKSGSGAGPEANYRAFTVTLWPSYVTS